MSVSYPSTNYNNLLRNNSLTQNNISIHREVNQNTNPDGTPILTNPTETLNNLYNVTTDTGILADLITEITSTYTALSSIGGDESVTGSNPSTTSATTDVFTNLKSIKLRHLQRQARLMCFELKRLTAECTKIAANTSSSIPLASGFNLPSSLPSPDPNSGY